jgi:hypothetical protein
MTMAEAGVFIFLLCHNPSRLVKIHDQNDVFSLWKAPFFFVPPPNTHIYTKQLRHGRIRCPRSIHSSWWMTNQFDDDIDAKLETAKVLLKKRYAKATCIAPKEEQAFKI